MTQRTVRLEEDGRMLDVSGQAVSQHDAHDQVWYYAERIEQTLCDADESRLLLLVRAGMIAGKRAPALAPAGRRIRSACPVNTGGRWCAVRQPFCLVRRLPVSDAG